MTRTQIASPDAPKAIGPYAQAVLMDGWLWCSGQIAIDPLTGNMIEATGPEAVARQTDRVLANLRAVLAAAGATPHDVVRCTVYLTDMGQFQTVNEIYGRFFGTERPPARATVAVSRLPKDALVEIDCVARVPDRGN
ncbi:MAG: Rid family detoxifying hydrolase [Planctomycetes bacterium]|nr:Rid family detoxifying hydrolase [Planctomycetota bacterium]